MRFGLVQFSLVMPWWNAPMLRHIMVDAAVIMCPMAEGAALRSVFPCRLKIPSD